MITGMLTIAGPLNILRVCDYIYSDLLPYRRQKIVDSMGSYEHRYPLNAYRS